MADRRSTRVDEEPQTSSTVEHGGGRVETASPPKEEHQTPITGNIPPLEPVTEGLCGCRNYSCSSHFRVSMCDRPSTQSVLHRFKPEGPSTPLCQLCFEFTMKSGDWVDESAPPVIQETTPIDL